MKEHISDLAPRNNDGELLWPYDSWVVKLSKELDKGRMWMEAQNKNKGSAEDGKVESATG